MRVLVILALPLLLVTGSAIALRQRSVLWQFVSIVSVAIAIAAWLTGNSSRGSSSVVDFVLFALFWIVPLRVSFIVARLTRQHSAYFAMLLIALAFVATLIFVISVGVDLGWITK